MIVNFINQKNLSFLNQKFKELEINEYEVYDVVPTKFSADVIEGGACCLYIRFKKIGEPLSHTNNGTFFSFYRMKDIDFYLKNGYEMFLKSDRIGAISNFELDIRKI